MYYNTVRPQSSEISLYGCFWALELNLPHKEVTQLWRPVQYCKDTAGVLQNPCNAVVDFQSSVTSLYGSFWALNYPFKEDTQLWCQMQDLYCGMIPWHVSNTIVTTASAQYLLTMYLWLPCMHAQDRECFKITSEGSTEPSLISSCHGVYNQSAINEPTTLTSVHFPLNYLGYDCAQAIICLLHIRYHQLFPLSKSYTLATNACNYGTWTLRNPTIGVGWPNYLHWNTNL